MSVDVKITREQRLKYPQDIIELIKKEHRNREGSHFTTLSFKNEQSILLVLRSLPKLLLTYVNIIIWREEQPLTSFRIFLDTEVDNDEYFDYAVKRAIYYGNNQTYVYPSSIAELETILSENKDVTCTVVAVDDEGAI